MGYPYFWNTHIYTRQYGFCPDFWSPSNRSSMPGPEIQFVEKKRRKTMRTHSKKGHKGEAFWGRFKVGRWIWSYWVLLWDQGGLPSRSLRSIPHTHIPQSWVNLTTWKMMLVNWGQTHLSCFFLGACCLAWSGWNRCRIKSLVSLEVPCWNLSNFKETVDGFTRWWQLKYVLCFTPIPGEMIQFDEHIFQMGWFNHQLVKISNENTVSITFKFPQLFV